MSDQTIDLSTAVIGSKWLCRDGSVVTYVAHDPRSNWSYIFDDGDSRAASGACLWDGTKDPDDVVAPAPAEVTEPASAPQQPTTDIDPLVAMLAGHALSGIASNVSECRVTDTEAAESVVDLAIATAAELRKRTKQ